MTPSSGRPDVDEENRRLWDEFDAMGIAEVRRQIATRFWREAKVRQAYAWIEHHESSRAAASALNAIEEARAANALARSANDLASDANAAVRDAADAAKANNRIAIAALAAAIISIIVSMLSTFLRSGGH